MNGDVSFESSIELDSVAESRRGRLLLDMFP